MACDPVLAAQFLDFEEYFAPFIEAMVTHTGLLDVCPCNDFQPVHEGIIILLHLQLLF